MEKVRGIGLIWFVIVVIALAVSIVIIAPHVFEGSKKEEIAQIKNDFTNIAAALDQYQLDNGRYPTTEQGLQALAVQPTTTPVPQYWKTGGYINPLPVDPWGQPYQYSNMDGVIRVYSFGESGANGGTEIDNTNISQQ